MRTKKIFKICLDITMTVIMVLLMDLSFTGLKLHELIGIGVFILFIVHKALNISWITSVSYNLFNPKVKTKVKLMFLLDVLLLIFVTANVFSGILISRHIFTNIEADNIALMSTLHHFFAWWTLLLILLHISLHLNRVADFISKKLNIKYGRKSVRAIVSVFFMMLSLLGAHNLSNKNLTGYLLPDFCSDIISSDVGKKYNDSYDYEYDDGRDNTDENQSQYGDDNDSISGSEDYEDYSIDNDQSGSDPTLEEYLSGFTCSACGHSCPLMALRCGRGQNDLNEKINEYNAKYSAQSSSDF